MTTSRKHNSTMIRQEYNELRQIQNSRRTFCHWAHCSNKLQQIHQCSWYDVKKYHRDYDLGIFWIGWVGAEFNMYPTQTRSLESRSSQPITWLILTNKTEQKNTQAKYQIHQNETTLVQSPLMTVNQEMRRAYSTMLPSPHNSIETHLNFTLNCQLKFSNSRMLTFIGDKCTDM